MKPAPFDFCAPRTKEQVLRALGQYAGETRILAGGQSLVPLLNFRQLRPARLIDINEVLEFSRITLEAGRIAFGATVRMADAAKSELVREHCPLLWAALPWVANPQVRNRATLVGNIVHGAPGAELPAVACALDAELIIESARSGTRSVSAENFYQLEPSHRLEPAEFVSAIALPIQPPGTRVAFVEAQRRSAHFALCGVGISFGLENHSFTNFRIGICALSPRPLRPRAWEAAFERKPATLESVAGSLLEVAALEKFASYNDLHATAEYRQEVAPVLVRRAVLEAIGLPDE